MGVLSPQRALVFRITHIENVAWTLANGLHSRTAPIRDPGFVEIGNPDLIEKRHRRRVPVPPGGTLGDYVPFYFTPYVPMLGNIKIGWNGIMRRPISEIVIVVSSLPALASAGIPIVFTDQHASLLTATFFSSLADLPRLDWALWQARDFQRDPRDLDKLARYQAEALAYRHVPVATLHGLVCYGDDEERALREMLRKTAATLEVIQRPGWFL
jgi:hypothetical protein